MIILVNISELESEACISQGCQGGADGPVTGVGASDQMDVRIQGNPLITQFRSHIAAGNIERANEAGLSRRDMDHHLGIGLAGRQANSEHRRGNQQK